MHVTYHHWSVAVLKICRFLHWIQSVDPHFYVTLYYNGYPPIFVRAEWAILLVDLRCPRGGSKLSIPIHFPGLAALMSADIA